MDYLEEKKPKVWPTRLLVAVSVLALLALIGFGLKQLLGNSGPQKKHTVHSISLLKPPPPPPPKPEEKPPEPEMKKEEVKVEQPKPDLPNQSDTPEGKQLGVDAEGGAGGDGFGLVGNKGGRDLLAGGMLAFAFYTNQLQHFLQDELAKHKKLKGTDYRVIVRVWIARNGTVQRAELAGSSGNGEIDETLRRALIQVPALRDPPPENMPQPVKVRITNQGAA